MKFFKTLFLLSLSISLLTTEARAIPAKRPFEGESKNNQPPLTLEEQTNRNRAGADRADSSNDEIENHDNDSSKRARGIACHATDASYQNKNPSSTAQDAHTSSSSSTMPPNEAAPSSTPSTDRSNR